MKGAPPEPSSPPPALPGNGNELRKSSHGENSEAPSSPKRNSVVSSELQKQEAEMKKAEVKKPKMIEKCSQAIVENSLFVGMTFALTIWALTSDDIRILVTEKPYDDLFNILVVVCLAIFTLEIFVSVLGKSDYWLGFFFFLDCISTGSLLLDLTWVNDWIAGNNGDGSTVRSGRTARIGAKSARMIRVLRLVRIIKLYKAYYEARQERLRRQREAAEGHGPGEDDWDEDIVEERPDAGTQESTLGKKLSELTTRKLIILILAMLITLPFLQGEESTKLPFSVEYGANNVYFTFKEFEASQLQQDRSEYQAALLHMVYYHNWYAGHAGENQYCPYGIDFGRRLGCSQEFWNRLYFIGIRGKTEALVDEKVALAKLHLSDVNSFNTKAAGQKESFYNYGVLPVRVQDLISTQEWKTCRKDTMVMKGISLISEDIDQYTKSPVACPQDLRLPESDMHTPLTVPRSEFEEWRFEFYFDMRQYNRESAITSLLTTLFVMILLLAGSVMFTSDANLLVIHPVEQMIKRVKAIRDNPLVAMKMADDEFRIEEIKRSKAKRKAKQRGFDAITMLQRCVSCRKGNKEGPMETVILEKTIIKLGSLLALGFGEAGANIISHNMRGADSAGVNAMVPGKHVDCIIGVCKVLDFSTATEVLQAGIMTFVNQIAEIIHGVVDEFHGAPNKNSGENFLIIWRVDPEDLQATHGRMAEMSIVAFAKILGALHRSALLADYRTHPGLQYRLGKGSRVNLSFGVHAGWAIEGAVGSEFKIDASYVSPNVSIAASVERCTQVYGVSLVVAQSAMALCSSEMVSKCRLVDRVLITGSATPMEIYCVDLDWTSVTVDESPPPEVVWNSKNRYRARQFIESQKNNKWSEEFKMAKTFDEDPSVSIMRQRYTEQFFQLFNMGYQNYSQGEWQVARRMLLETRHILGKEDGPSSALLRYMEDPHQFEAPKDWQQYRDMSGLIV